MSDRKKLELLLLHALPFDGSMWAGQRDVLPESTYAPTLYGLGDSVEAWAAAALKLVQGERLIVIGCSVGGSCAIELAIAAPDRIAALVLIGTKAGHRPDPALHAAAVDILQQKGLEDAWNAFWAPLFSSSVSSGVLGDAKRMALRQSPPEVARGVTAFHSRPSRDQFLSALSCPVIVVTGADDSAPGLKVSAAQADAARQGRLHVIPGCGHYVPLERPEALNAILREVIAGQQWGGTGPQPLAMI
jgi:pimeloyl-ACP methyl ester carboxylesterase